MEAFSPQKACRSCCKADIRNPLPYRLVLRTLEAGECLFYLQIITILQEKTVSFFSYFMTFLHFCKADPVCLCRMRHLRQHLFGKDLPDVQKEQR